MSKPKVVIAKNERYAIITGGSVEEIVEGVDTLCQNEKELRGYQTWEPSGDLEIIPVGEGRVVMTQAMVRRALGRG